MLPFGFDFLYILACHQEALRAHLKGLYMRFIFVSRELRIL